MSSTPTKPRKPADPELYGTPGHLDLPMETAEKINKYDMIHYSTIERRYMCVDKVIVIGRERDIEDIQIWAVRLQPSSEKQ